MNDVDVAVVGAGAAGVAAGLRLAQAGVSFVLLEARDRVGGRAHTVVAGGLPLDLGCGWLHAAERNAWVPRFEALGLAVDRSEPPWGKPSANPRFPPDEQAEYRDAFDRLERRLSQAAEAAEAGIAPDRPGSDFMEPGGRWNGLLDAFSGFYNGAPFSEVSVVDYGRYDEGRSNWRMRDGYGAAVARAAQKLPVRLGAGVHALDWSGPGVRLETTQGSLSARAAVVTLPSDVLARGSLRFTPALPDKLQAAAALPLGFAAKAFLALSAPEAFPEGRTAYGRIDTDRTASFHFRPFGRPYVEAYFGDGLAAELEAAGPGELGAFAVQQLGEALGGAVPGRVSVLAETSWSVDPFSLGAYSHATVGCADQRARLAESVADRLFFAGEACSRTAFSTAHGAYETGVRAADEALAVL